MPDDFVFRVNSSEFVIPAAPTLSSCLSYFRDPVMSGFQVHTISHPDLTPPPRVKCNLIVHGAMDKPEIRTNQNIHACIADFAQRRLPMEPNFGIVFEHLDFSLLAEPRGKGGGQPHDRRDPRPPLGARPEGAEDAHALRVASSPMRPDSSAPAAGRAVRNAGRRPGESSAPARGSPPRRRRGRPARGAAPRAAPGASPPAPPARPRGAR